MSGFGGGGGSEMPMVRAESTNNTPTMANGIAVHTISTVLFPSPCSGSRSPSRHRGDPSSAYRTMPTTTAKMITITAMTTMVRSKIARACGDCGLNTLTTSATNSAALNEWRFISFRLPALANGGETEDERHSDEDDNKRALPASRTNFATVEIKTDIPLFACRYRDAFVINGGKPREWRRCC